MSDQANVVAQSCGDVAEQPVTLIPITLEISNAQISGLSWFGDNLIVLPQYPNWAGTPGDGVVEVLSKADILAFLDGRSAAPLVPRHVPFVTSGLEKRIAGFEGYEAMSVIGDRFYLTVEASPGRMTGYIVAGTIAPDASELRLDPEALVEIPSQAEVRNASYETLLMAGDRLVALYEANGARINPQPMGHVFDLSLRHLEAVPVPNIEYRITDATTARPDGTFWVMNYYWPGDERDYMPGPDQIAATYGQGPTHLKYGACERLVQFRYSPEGISLAGTPPIQLELLDVTHSRNWEGLVELDDRGFLIITDEFPETLLGFVSHSFSA